MKTLKEELESMTEFKMRSMTEAEFDAWCDSFCEKPLTWEEAKKLDEIMDKFYGNDKKYCINKKQTIKKSSKMYLIPLIIGICITLTGLQLLLPLLEIINSGSFLCAYIIFGILFLAIGIGLIIFGIFKKRKGK